MTPPDFLLDFPAKFSLQQDVPERLFPRLQWLATRYHATQIPYQDGLPNANARAGKRWQRFWPRITMLERGVIWKLWRGGSVATLIDPSARWQYQPPTADEVIDLRRLEAAIYRHFLTPDMFQGLLEQTGQALALPALPPAAVARLQHAFLQNGRPPDTFDWQWVRQLLAETPPLAEAWTHPLTEMLEQVLRCYLDAARCGDYVEWPLTIRHTPAGEVQHA